MQVVMKAVVAGDGSFIYADHFPSIGMFFVSKSCTDRTGGKYHRVKCVLQVIYIVVTLFLD